MAGWYQVVGQVLDGKHRPAGAPVLTDRSLHNVPGLPAIRSQFIQPQARLVVSVVLLWNSEKRLNARPFTKIDIKHLRLKDLLLKVKVFAPQPLSSYPSAKQSWELQPRLDTEAEAGRSGRGGLLDLASPAAQPSLGLHR